jgi:fucokinase
MKAFTHLIVTAPTVAIAATYTTLCNDLQERLSELRHTKVIVVADPVGVRVGSGGGTLNALQHFLSLHGGVDGGLARAKIAIIHSGGDSRRAPLHSVCGKAWANINCIADSSGMLGSPMALLVKELTSFCEHLQEGSIVIASSDVLLDIAKVG